MVDIDKVVATWTHDIPDDGVCAKCHQMTHTPYDFEPTALCNTCAQEAVINLLATLEQLQGTNKDLSDFLVSKNEYLDGLEKELAFELETQTKQAKKLQALNGVQHMNGVLQKRVAELEGLLKESYQALIDHCSWLGEDALPPRINKALAPKKVNDG